jgi:hypothetical protein
MEPHLPNDVLYRPKMGFPVPLARWFRGPLKQRVRIMLGSRLADTGWFNRDYLQHLRDHNNGSRDYSASIWTILMFEAFLRNVMEAGKRHDRVLHVLDHSIPLHSGYTFRTAALLREQRAWAGKPSTSPPQAGRDIHPVRRCGWPALLPHPARHRFSGRPAHRPGTGPDAATGNPAGSSRPRHPAGHHPCPFAGTQRPAGHQGRPQTRHPGRL